MLGTLAVYRGDYERARRHGEESVALWQAATHPLGVASALVALANIVHQAGDIGAFHAYAERCLLVYQELGDRRGVALALGQLGHAAWHERDYAQARGLTEEAVTVWRELGNRREWFTTQLLWQLGAVLRDQGELAAARAVYVECMAIARETRHRHRLATLLDAFASLAVAKGQPHRGAQLLGAAEALREASEVVMVPAYREDFHQPILADVRAALDAGALAAAWAAGRELSLDAAVALALAQPESSVTLPADVQSLPDGLTPREVEVLGLLASGLSNREVAERLVVSVRTVGRHVDNIYGKIGVHERGKARQYARDHGLIAPLPSGA